MSKRGLDNVKILILDYCVLGDMPNQIVELKNLQLLSMCCCQINSIPERAFNNWRNLRELKLRMNSIETLPSNIINLTNLQLLDVSQNELLAYLPAINQLPTVNTLRLDYINVRSSLARLIPAPYLRKLSAKHMSITSIPVPFCYTASQLQVLSLSHNSLRIVPRAIEYLFALHVLELSRNLLESLPASIGDLKNLCILDLENNSLRDLPDSMQNLTNLSILMLSKNKFTSFPPCITKLLNLKCLLLSNNSLVTVPEELSNLQELEYLDLENTQLSSIPKSLTNIKALNLSRNSFSVNPKTNSPILSLAQHISFRTDYELLQKQIATKINEL